MANVYVAKRTGMDREVALKRIRRDKADQTFRTMFIDETKVTANLSHPNIVQCHDCGKFNDECFMVMELVDGYDLRSVIGRAKQKKTKLPLGFVAYCIAGVARGLSYAHKREIDGKPQRIVHRDVSPHNILISKDGIVKIADFGIAKAAERSAHTEAGFIKGKHSYMAPEQVTSSGDIDHRADIFALAAVTYELASLRTLFSGQGELSTLTRVRDVALPENYSETLNDYPHLEEILDGALHPEPEHRYADACLFAKRLETLTFNDEGAFGVDEAAKCLQDLFNDESAGDADVLPIANSEDDIEPPCEVIVAKRAIKDAGTVSLGPKPVLTPVMEQNNSELESQQKSPEHLVVFLDEPPVGVPTQSQFHPQVGEPPKAAEMPSAEADNNGSGHDNGPQTSPPTEESAKKQPAPSAEGGDGAVRAWKTGGGNKSIAQPSSGQRPTGPTPGAANVPRPTRPESKHKIWEIAAAGAVAGLLMFFFVFDAGSSSQDPKTEQAIDDMRGEFPELRFKNQREEPPSVIEVSYLFNEQARREERKVAMPTPAVAAPRKIEEISVEQRVSEPPKKRGGQPGHLYREVRSSAALTGTAAPATMAPSPTFLYAEGGEADTARVEESAVVDAQPTEKTVLQLPVLTKIPVSLSIGISSTRQDKVLGLVTKAVKGKTGTVLIPKGAVVGGLSTGRDKQRIYVRFDWVKFNGEKHPIAGQASTGARKSRYGLPAVVREATTEERQSAEFAKGSLQVLRDVAVAGAGGLGRNLSTLGDGAVEEGKKSQDVDDGLVLTVAAGKTFTVIIVE